MEEEKQITVGIIGSGMAGLAAGTLLATNGFKVKIFEQNYLPGGCSSSYWRKGFTFETGATTLVGFQEGQPLAYLAERTGVNVEKLLLELPMQVHLSKTSTISRYQDIDLWIAEAEKHFGKKGQAAFWKFCYRVSQFVWKTSTRQRFFPPEKPSDFLELIKAVSLEQPIYGSLALISTERLMQWFGLDKNEAFVAFVNQQLLITAQNNANEVNALFGAAALCYTNYENHYVPGGLLNLVTPFVEKIEAQGGEVLLRHSVTKVDETESGLCIQTQKQGNFNVDKILFAIPANNVVDLFPEATKSLKLMLGDKLASAMQIGIGFNPHKEYASLHNQIHLPKGLNQIGSKSIFLSLSHPSDHFRSDEEGLMVASVSSHIPNPDKVDPNFQKQLIIDQVLEILEKQDFIKKDNIVYLHCSLTKEWQQWTARKWGFVGGYPQFMRIKPWQMNGHRLRTKSKLTTAYICGDTTYPGQGIPGAALSGIIAAEKLMADYLNEKK